jgi:predicted nucleic acid-binding protein
MTASVVDSGVLYALFDTRDEWHLRSVAFFKAHAQDAVVPFTILGEVGYMVESRLGPGGPRSLADWLSRGLVQFEGLLPQDLRRMTLLMSRYPALGFVDSSVVAMAERLMIDTIATADRRHFTDLRPSHVERFTLVP